MNNDKQNRIQLAYQSLYDSSNSILPLYNIVEKKIFRRLDYGRLSCIIQHWMMEARSSEESSWSKEMFEKNRDTYNCRTVNRFFTSTT